MERLTDANFSGNGWLKTSSAKEYSITADFYVPEAGFYNVSTVTYPNGGAVYLSEYKITVGGKDYAAGDMAEESGTYPSIFKKYVSKRVVKLEKGKNTIAFTPTTLRNMGQAMDYCFCMDYVKLEKTVLDAIRYEGEELDRTTILGTGGYIEDSSATGGGFQQIIRDVNTYQNSFDIKADAPAAGHYRFTFCGSGPDTNSEFESKYAIYFKNEKLNLQSTQTGRLCLSCADVELDEGVNTFTIVAEPWTLNDPGSHYVLNCDYYEITMLSESEPASKIVIEAEKGYEVQNFTPVVADEPQERLKTLRAETRTPR